MRLHATIQKVTFADASDASHNVGEFMKQLRFFTVVLLTAHVVAGAVRAQTTPQAADAFEVVSIRPLGPMTGNSFGTGCDGGFPRVEHNRFTVTTTTYALLTWAYGFNKNGGCSFVSYGNFLFGGPDWIRTDRFTIQALMPEGSPDYTTAEFLNGKAPKLETMILNLLADRFKITLHREMKEGPVYELVVGKGGAKLTPAQETDKYGMGTLRRTDPAGQVTYRLTGRKTTMTYLALMLVLETRRPVIDRTGISGEFNFDVDYAPLDSNPATTAGATIFTAIQEQLGLKLDSARAPVEVLVIDRAEKPTPN